jgi:hypothetical protein
VSAAHQEQLAALHERVDGHDAKFDALFTLMRETVRTAGVDLDNPSVQERRRDRHLHLVTGGQP